MPLTIKRYILKPTSNWVTPLRSDTLHGLLLCQVREWEGEKKCQELADRFINGEKPFTCSSLMPQNSVPMPKLPSITRKKFKKDNTTLVSALKEYKDFRKRSSIPLKIWEKYMSHMSYENLFKEFCDKNSSWNAYKSDEEKTLEIAVEPHNTISRANGTTIEGGLYFHEVKYHKNQLFDIYVEAEDHAWFLRYLKIIGELGFGADSSTGKGLFEVEEDATHVQSLFNLKGTHQMTLSVLSAENMQGLSGYYKLFTKKGRTWAGMSDVTPFKKPFLALEEGAVLKDMPQGKCLLENIHANKAIIQLCHALTLPCTPQFEKKE